MHIALEQSDLDLITAKVIEALKPLIAGKSEGTGDTIFDKKGLSEYLKVDVSWIDKQVVARAIPFFKLGKYVRFKKSTIDRWVDSMEKNPSPYLKMLKSR